MTLEDIEREVKHIQLGVMRWKNSEDKAWLLEHTIMALGLVKVEIERSNTLTQDGKQ